MRIIETKLLNSPVFSGHFGGNIFKSSPYLQDLLKDVPIEPGAGCDSWVDKDESVNNRTP
jgi:hypothetical protein